MSSQSSSNIHHGDELIPFFSQSYEVSPGFVTTSTSEEFAFDPLYAVAEGRNSDVLVDTLRECDPTVPMELDTDSALPIILPNELQELLNSPLQDQDMMNDEILNSPLSFFSELVPTDPVLISSLLPEPPAAKQPSQAANPVWQTPVESANQLTSKEIKAYDINPQNKRVTLSTPHIQQPKPCRDLRRNFTEFHMASLSVRQRSPIPPSSVYTLTSADLQPIPKIWKHQQQVKIVETGSPLSRLPIRCPQSYLNIHSSRHPTSAASLTFLNNSPSCSRLPPSSMIATKKNAKNPRNDWYAHNPFTSSSSEPPTSVALVSRSPTPQLKPYSSDDLPSLMSLDPSRIIRSVPVEHPNCPYSHPLLYKCPKHAHLMNKSKFYQYGYGLPVGLKIHCHRSHMHREFPFGDRIQMPFMQQQFLNRKYRLPYQFPVVPNTPFKSFRPSLRPSKASQTKNKLFGEPRYRTERKAQRYSAWGNATNRSNQNPNQRSRPKYNDWKSNVVH